MPKKAPDPKVYWLAQVEVLAAQWPVLYEEVKEYRFSRWDAAAFSEREKLTNELMAGLTNVYGYARSTFFDGIQNAIGKREKILRTVAKTPKLQA